MKQANRIIFYFIALLLLSCSDKSKDAINYNEKIVLSYQKVTDIEEKLIFYLLADDTLNFDKDYDRFINQIDSSEKEIKLIGAFEGYSDFYVAALNMINVYRKVASIKILDLMVLKREKVNPNKTDSLNKANDFGENLKSYNSIIENEFLKFDTAQQKFASKFGFKLL